MKKWALILLGGELLVLNLYLVLVNRDFYNTTALVLIPLLTLLQIGFLLLAFLFHDEKKKAAAIVFLILAAAATFCPWPQPENEPVFVVFSSDGDGQTLWIDPEDGIQSGDLAPMPDFLFDFNSEEWLPQVEVDQWPEQIDAYVLTPLSAVWYVLTLLYFILDKKPARLSAQGVTIAKACVFIAEEILWWSSFNFFDFFAFLYNLVFAAFFFAGLTKAPWRIEKTKNTQALQ